MSLTLHQMPDDALDNILKFVDYQGIFTLRTVCKDLRNFIDAKKTDIHLTTLEVHIDKYRIKLYCDDQWGGVKYEKNEDGFLLISKGNGEEFQEETDYFLDFFSDFKTIISHQKSILECFLVAVDYEIDQESLPILEYFFKNFKEIMTQKTPKLRAKRARFENLNQDKIMAILPFLNPEVLNVISLCGPAKDFGRKSLNFQEITELEQWSKCKELFLYPNMSINAKLNRFAHFGELKNITLDVVTAEDLFALKEKFLTNSRPQFADINYINLIDEELFRDTIGKPMETEDGVEKWFYRIGRSDDAVSIRMERKVDDYNGREIVTLSIKFGRITWKSVPDHVKGMIYWKNL